MQDIYAHIAKLRTANQLIAGRHHPKPNEVVGWFGAMQAQDYPAAKWAIAARSTTVTNTDIEQLITEKQLVRTWPMRGTIHFVQPADVGWMLELMAGRVFQKFASVHAALGLNQSHFDLCTHTLEEAMKRRALIRKQMYAALTEAGANVEGQRLYHTIVYLAHRGLLAIAELQEKQPTFVWFDSWFPKANRRHLDRTASLVQMAQYYVQSHGPVTVHDFAWWTGLTVADAREAFRLLDDRIVQLPEAPEYWLMADSLPVAGTPDSVFLAPSFDESIVALKDRGAIVRPEDFKKLTPYANGIFKPAILVNGRFVGTWKRVQKAKGVIIHCEILHTLTKAQSDALGFAAERYAAFLEQSLVEVTRKNL